MEQLRAPWQPERAQAMVPKQVHAVQLEEQKPVKAGAEPKQGPAKSDEPAAATRAPDGWV